MMMIMSITIFFFFLSNLKKKMSMILSKKSFMDRKKCSPFEWGFDPKSMSQIPFSLHFFLITIIFLIFDEKIALIFPIITLFKMENMLTWMKTSLFFIMILQMGLYREWNQNILNWPN
uniref:NADH dehydrogenase subunit 3 n=1 Tax=Leucoma salicis TaxID=688415 RepID=UPI002008EE46|nr:NADH dehydrogenase subunit 3 [Leucoma salicis]UOX27464.1 NADH dehydrogenase subunit 3 [Leucoma salicis]